MDSGSILQYSKTAAELLPMINSNIVSPVYSSLKFITKKNSQRNYLDISPEL